MLGNKSTYKALCETEGSGIPLFLQYWWMETVCRGKQWDVLMAYDEAGEPMAALPYLIGSRWGFKYVLQPQLTQFNGPWYRPDCLHSEADRQLVSGMKDMKLKLFCQNFAPGIQPSHHWDTYEIKERRTYRLNDISDAQRVFDGFDKSRRQRQILRAEKLLTPDEGLTPELFADFHAAYWHSRGQRDLVPHDFMVRVMSAALAREQGILMGLRDAQGVLQAARFVVLDSESAYSLLSALNPEGHHNGASPLLFWLIIQRLAGRTRSFDFEGSMDPGIAFSYSLYGAVPARFCQVMHLPPAVRAYLGLRKAIAMRKNNSATRRKSQD